MRAAFRRLRHSIDYSFFKKAEYDKKLRDLERKNGRLRSLRDQVAELKSYYTHHHTSLSERSTKLPEKFEAVQVASRSLHQELESVIQHDAMLALDAEVSESVRFDVAISCECRNARE